MIRQLASLVALAALFAAQPQARSVQASGAPRAEAKPGVLINLNTATAAELEKLPGIGPTVAARIIEYRLKKGPFKKIEELMNVPGIGEKSFLKLKEQITVVAKPDPRVPQQN